MAVNGKKVLAALLALALIAAGFFALGRSGLSNDTIESLAAESGGGGAASELISKLEHKSDTASSTVYFTSDISAEGLVKAYEALNWTPGSNLAVKMSTGESEKSNYLRPALIGDLVNKLNGTIVECNTAYGGNRASAAAHKQLAQDHGLTTLGKGFDLLDEEGNLTLTVTGAKAGSNLRITENYVGSHLSNYDSALILSHFKGHAMAGFGGAIKNISIGFGSGSSAGTSGKVWIHSGGTRTSGSIMGDQNAFLEAMGDAGLSIANYFGNGKDIVYINVMNRLSVDCDCDGNPSEPDMHDIGILASIDPVALDQASIDFVYAASDSASLKTRIESRNGLHTLEHAAEIGLGNREYKLVSLDGESAVVSTSAAGDTAVDAVSGATERALKLQIGNPTMTLDGVESEIDPGRGTAPVIQDGRTLLPVRALIESIGGSVSWDAESRTASLEYGSDTIKLTIDSKTASLNGEARELDVAPVIVNGRTMLPIRFISESLGFGVDWDQSSKTVSIYVPTGENAGGAEVTTGNGENAAGAAVTTENGGETGGKVLVAYFSRTGENYSVGTISEGNTAKLAKEIAAQTGGELFEIVPEASYPEKYDDTLPIATRERENDERPAISTSISNFSEYDTVYIGCPVWWGKLPMIMYTFMESYDFSGKTVIPFNTHEGSGQGTIQSEIETKLKDSTVLKGLAMRGSIAQKLAIDGKDSTVSEWLSGLK